jgi:hypothetical protein
MIYVTKYNQYIDENNVLVSEADLLAYLQADGTVLPTDFVFPNDAASEALELETQRYVKRTQDGINAYAKISAEFRLAKLTGQISEAAHGYIENLLIPVRNEVLAGQWISGLQKLEAIGVLQVGQELYDRLHSQLTDYITENYQV